MLWLVLHLKPLSAFVSVACSLTAYFFYFRGIFRKETHPHLYTWLVWTITTGTAAAGIWYGGGGYGSISITISSALTFVLFLFSFRYGTRNITASDTAFLVLAFITIAAWVVWRAPLASVFLATITDALGYFPTFRKSYEEPWSEPLPSWFFFTFPTVFTFIALNTYNLLTTMYLAMCICFNLTLILICLVRRRSVPKPQAV